MTPAERMRLYRLRNKQKRELLLTGIQTNENTGKLRPLRIQQERKRKSANSGKVHETRIKLGNTDQHQHHSSSTAVAAEPKVANHRKVPIRHGWFLRYFFPFRL